MTETSVDRPTENHRPVIAGVILTYNEARHIAACIKSLAFADVVMVFDSYSSDDTVAIASAAGAMVIQHRFTDFASQRNAALLAAAQIYESPDWVLFTDADERVTPELADEIQHVVQKEGYAGWRIPRYNYLFGRLTRHAGWYPDYQTRLLHVGSAHYDASKQVHEIVILDGAEGTCTQHFVHYNYDTVSQFREKQRRYTELDARILFQANIRPRWRNYILQPLRTFRRRFVTLRGYRDGWHGLHLSLLLAYYEWLKYRRLRQLWQIHDADVNS